MRKKPILYTCPACGYETNRKDNMRGHLYNRKPCPKAILDIELTDEIKEYIMVNRVYHPPKSSESNATSSSVYNDNKTVNNHINHINHVNNFVVSMDFMDKLNKLVDYIELSIVDFEDKVADLYLTTASRLEEDTINMELKTNDIIKVLNNVSIVNDKKFENFNIFYDKKCNEISWYELGQWKSELIDNGLKSVLEIVRDNYWNQYELSLIRKIKKVGLSLLEKQKSKELLEEYYRFIACFDIEPCVYSLNSDSEISYDFSGDDIVNEYKDLFYKLDGKLDKTTIKEIKNKVKETIKNSTLKNIQELNKCVIELIHKSDNNEFKTFLLQP